MDFPTMSPQHTHESRIWFRFTAVSCMQTVIHWSNVCAAKQGVILPWLKSGSWISVEACWIGFAISSMSAHIKNG